MEPDIEGVSLEASPPGQGLLRSDLIVQALDLRVRVALYPLGSQDDLDDRQVLLSALDILLAYPDTAAVAVVLGDGELTARIYEPFDSPEAIFARGQASTRGGRLLGPLRKVMVDYLRQVNPGWTAPPRFDSGRVKFDDAASAASRDSLANIQSQRKNTPEWRTARLSLSDADRAWASTIALQTLSGHDDAIIGEVESQARKGGNR